MMQETKLNEENASFFKSFSRMWDGVYQEAIGSKGGMVVLWNLDKVAVDLINKQKNWMHCKVRILQEEMDFSLFNVYGPTKTEEKKRVWIEIIDQIRMIDSEKAIVAGDFNALLYNEEKFGGLSMNARVMEDFRNFVTNNNLFDVVPKFGKFTWTNRRANFSRIYESLDRIFVGSFWLRDSTFEVNIEKWWKECIDIKGTPSYCFIKKMKYLKNKIKIWNVVSFKNIFAEKLRVEVELDRINNLVTEKGMMNEEYYAEISLKVELAEILLREEMFWRDKSRELWLDAGDSNSKFFYASLKAKRNKNRINQLKDVLGKMVGKAEELENLAVKYVVEILGSSEGDRDESVEYLLDIIDKQILEEDNASVLASITKDEVKKATFELHSHKALGLDGVTMELYQRCWKFMGEDIWMVVEEFQRKGKFVKEINNTLIALIPKKQSCQSIADYRPISLSEEIDDMVWVNEVEAVVGPYVADYIMDGQMESEWIEWKLVGEWKMEKNVELKDILNRKNKSSIKMKWTSYYGVHLN
ncbi:uncharacterized protein LOC131029424 [Cryptomeria japonica]|uniref:uncharacterized protein LOC131029424 n=1 Tax=Cryptomeria japonica TaxID=3369 RepID=UPI0025AC094B|nr:uncharacterized protein LOC131029424 [Cryptomeria japonica]